MRGDSTRATRVESVMPLVYSGNFKDKCTQSEKRLARVDYIKFNFLRFSKGTVKLDFTRTLQSVYYRKEGFRSQEHSIRAQLQFRFKTTNIHIIYIGVQSSKV